MSIWLNMSVNLTKLGNDSIRDEMRILLNGPPLPGIARWDFACTLGPLHVFETPKW